MTSVRQPTDAVPVLSADFSEGYAVGFEHGYRQAEDDMAAAWAQFAKPTALALARAVGLSHRRWRLRGEARTRETFGRPHPDDFPGRGDA